MHIWINYDPDVMGMTNNAIVADCWVFTFENAGETFQAGAMHVDLKEIGVVARRLSVVKCISTFMLKGILRSHFLLLLRI